jgi:hypothetical protein
MSRSQNNSRGGNVAYSSNGYVTVGNKRPNRQQSNGRSSFRGRGSSRGRGGHSGGRHSYGNPAVEFTHVTLGELMKNGLFKMSNEEQTIVIAKVITDINESVAPLRKEIDQIHEKADPYAIKLQEYDEKEKERSKQIEADRLKIKQYQVDLKELQNEMNEFGSTEMESDIKELEGEIATLEGRVKKYDENKNVYDAERKELSTTVNQYQAKAKKINEEKISPILDRARWVLCFLIRMHIYGPFSILFQREWPTESKEEKDKQFIAELNTEDQKLYHAARIVYDFFRKAGEIGTYSYPGYALFPIIFSSKPELAKFRKMMEDNGYKYSKQNMIQTIKMLQHYGYHSMWRHRSQDGKTDENLYEMAAASYQKGDLDAEGYQSVINELNKPSRRIKESIVINMLSKITATTATSFGTAAAFICLQPEGCELIAEKLVSQCTSLPTTAIDTKTGRMEIAAGYMRDLKTAVFTGPDKSCLAMTKTFFAKNSYDAKIAWARISSNIIQRANNFDKFYNKGAAGALIGETAVDNTQQFISWAEDITSTINTGNAEKIGPIIVTALVHARVYTQTIEDKLAAIKKEVRGKIKYDILGCLEQFKTVPFKLIEVDTTEEKKFETDIIKEVVEISVSEVQAIDKTQLVKPVTQEKKHKRSRKQATKEEQTITVYSNPFSALEDDAENGDDENEEANDAEEE